jgi:hypothetical protein
MIAEPERFWWPLCLSQRELEAVAATSDELRDYAPEHDRPAALRASTMLAEAMREHVHTIVDFDKLGSHAHIVNGWGNAPFEEGHLLDRYARSIHRTAKGAPHISQGSSEGDQHPWQSFAYAMMAGLDGNELVTGTGCTLRELALNSCHLDTDDADELGHLLYAAAMLRLPGTTEFELRTQKVNLCELADRAVDAHYEGSFTVCRKFHLTEGLCAIAAGGAGSSDLRGTAQGFLEGQLDQLTVFAAVVSGLRDARARGQKIDERSVVADLRNSLVINTLVENHYYLAGHLIELATLAAGLGYTVRADQWAAARFIADELNRLLPEYLSRVWFPGCFLHLGHYRRAITLLDELAEGSLLNGPAMARYTADLRSARRSCATRRSREPAGDGVFSVASEPDEMRPELAAVLQAYAEIAAPNLRALGGRNHFRRVLVPGWPRWLHFEILDYGSRALRSESASPTTLESRGGVIGLEVHIEQPNQGTLVAALRELASKSAGAGPLRRAEFDPSWHENSGRLRLPFPDETDPRETAGALQALIEAVIPVLAPEVERLFPTSP